MALLSYQQAAAVGADIALAAAAGGGDTVAPRADGIVLVRNGSGAEITVTVVVPGSQYGKARPDITKAVAAGAFAAFGPFPTDLADPTDQLVDITYSAVTTVTVAAIRI